jgi:hypothetical protein
MGMVGNPNELDVYVDADFGRTSINVEGATLPDLRGLAKGGVDFTALSGPPV